MSNEGFKIYWLWAKFKAKNTLGSNIKENRPFHPTIISKKEKKTKSEGHPEKAYGIRLSEDNILVQ